MKRLMALACVAVLGSTAGSLEAQHRHPLQSRGYFGVGGGLGVPSGRFDTNANLGWIGQAFAGYTTRRGLWGGRIDASFGRNPLGGPGSFWLGGATANAVVTPGHRPARFHPYFLAGVGVYHVTSTGGSGETRLALNGGTGVQLHLGHRSDLFVEGRYLTIRTGQAVNLIPVTFGFRWGGI
jgi:hypothetical protein